jgi:hypothetical protein
MSWDCGRGDCPLKQSVWTTVWFDRRDQLGQIQPAVAIRALGLRLRASVRPISRFGSALRPVNSFVLAGQSPLPGRLLEIAMGVVHAS